MIDIASETWATIKKACDQTIESAMGELMRSGYPTDYYEGCRGRIAACREILALAEPRLVQPSGDYAKSKNRAGI